MKGGKRDAVCVGERESFVWERIGTFVSCRFLPVKSDDINEKMKLRAPAQCWECCVCVCMLGRDDDLSEPAGYELCLPNRPTAAGLQWCGPLYSSPLSAGRHAAPHFRFYCIASVSPSRGAHRGAVATAVIWPGKVKFTLWQAIAKAWDVKSGRVLWPFHVWVATFWSERKVSHCRCHTV